MWRRLALIPVGLLLAALLLEGGLRGAASLARRREARPTEGGRTVLCVGDSNTYGVYVRDDETYPARLEALLRAADPTARAVNLGVPGHHTREIRDDAEEGLARHAAVAVLFLGGVNDLWGETGESAGAIGRFFSSLRLVRLARILLARAPPDGLVDIGRGGPEYRLRGRAGGDILIAPPRIGRSLGADELRRRITKNLGATAAAANSAGAVPIFLTYGPEDGPLAVVNGAVRAFCAERGDSAIDVAILVKEVARRGWYTEFYYADSHPRAAGYELIARLAFNELVRRGLSRGEPFADPLAGLEPRHAIPTEALNRDRKEARIRLEGSLDAPDSLALEIEDAPGLVFQVLLSLADPPPWTKPLTGEAFRKDPLLTIALGDRDLRGRFDGTGRARVPLGAFTREAGRNLQGRKVQVAYLVKAYEEDPWVRGLSGTVAVELR